MEASWNGDPNIPCFKNKKRKWQINVVCLLLLKRENKLEYSFTLKYFYIFLASAFPVLQVTISSNHPGDINDCTRLASCSPVHLLPGQKTMDAELNSSWNAPLLLSLPLSIHKKQSNTSLRAEKTKQIQSIDVRKIIKVFSHCDVDNFYPELSAKQSHQK